jgi:hypothetical protein
VLPAGSEGDADRFCDGDSGEVKRPGAARRRPLSCGKSNSGLQVSDCGTSCVEVRAIPGLKRETLRLCSGQALGNPSPCGGTLTCRRGWRGE